MIRSLKTAYRLYHVRFSMSRTFFGRFFKALLCSSQALSLALVCDPPSRDSSVILPLFAQNVNCFLHFSAKNQFSGFQSIFPRKNETSGFRADTRKHRGFFYIRLCNALTAPYSPAHRYRRFHSGKRLLPSCIWEDQMPYPHRRAYPLQ